MLGHVSWLAVILASFIRGILNRWFKFYLSNLTRHAPINVLNSHNKLMKYGVSSVQVRFMCAPPLSPVGGGGVSSYQIFKKGGLDRVSVLRGGYWERGCNFFQEGGCSFYIKSKLKSEIFNYKKVCKVKKVLPCPN